MMRKQQGISLVELMISAVLASLIISLIMQQYLISQRQYQQAHALLTTNLELQLANEMVRDSLRRAGFTPCGGISNLETVDKRTGETHLAAIRIGHQSLHVNRMSEYFATVSRQLNASQLLVDAHIPFKKQQIVLIADCEHAEVQPILSVQKSNSGLILTLTKALQFHYQSPFYLGEWIEEDFFVQKNRYGELALFYRHQHAEELTNLVDKMAVEITNNAWVVLTWQLKNTQLLRIETRIRAG